MTSFRSLYMRLALAILAIFLLVGAMLVALVEDSSQELKKKTEQELHRGLAATLVHDNPLLHQGVLDYDALSNAFHTMMVLGPRFEFYILDTQGVIQTYSADPEKILRQSVNLEPVNAFLSGKARFPIRGDDPRSTSKRKIFSAAPIDKTDGSAFGYLYVIIDGELYDNVAVALQQDHNMRVMVMIVVAGVALALLMSLLAFRWLTQPLSRLTKQLQLFRASQFENDGLISKPDHESSSELNQLQHTCHEMASLIASQIEQLQTLDKTRREFFAQISHDLRTPLASVMGYLETLQLKLNSADPEQLREFLGIAEKSAKQVNDLVNQLFELAHLESGNVMLDDEPFVMAELVQDVLAKFAIRGQKAGVKLDFEARSPRVMVKADLGKIERVLTNLIENAIRYTPEGGLVTVHIGDSHDGLVDIDVEDTGRGIAAAELPFVFERYYRGTQSHSAQGVNAGLGLAICKKLVQLHTSDLDVSSEEGKGTRFHFALKMA